MYIGWPIYSAGILFIVRTLSAAFQYKRAVGFVIIIILVDWFSAARIEQEFGQELGYGF